MKNLMGCIWDRRAYHVDEHVAMDKGPQNATPTDVVVKKALFASADIVAVDTLATKFHASIPFKLDPAGD